VRRILYVEDEKADQSAFVREAARRGFTAVDVESQGANVLARVRSSEPSILVVDWRLDKGQLSSDYHAKDGVLLACRARTMWPHIPVLVLTNHDYEEEEKDPKWKDPGFRYMSKACEWDEIFAVVTEMTGGR
jgi:CheY-like chemotaxis protein